MMRAIRMALVGAAVAVLIPVALSAQQRGAMDKPAARMDAGKMGKMDTAMNEFKPFTQEAFDAAAAEGKTTLVFFHAPWCSVCKAQEPKVLAHLNGDARQVVAFKVDYDTNKELRQAMKVVKQSTLILYQGTKEVARLSYKSDDASIDELFRHAAMKMSMQAPAAR